MTKLDSIFGDFQKAVQRLDESLKTEKTEISRDSAILRFELAFESGWKCLKAFLEEKHNKRCASPQNCFREAFNVGLLDYDDIWLKISGWRNDAVHTYKEKLAEELYLNLPVALESFKGLAEKIKKEIS